MTRKKYIEDSSLTIGDSERDDVLQLFLEGKNMVYYFEGTYHLLLRRSKRSICGSVWRIWTIYPIFREDRNRERKREVRGRRRGRVAAFLCSFAKSSCLLLNWKMVFGREKAGLPTQVQNGDVPLDSGHARLHQLGYKQELKRDLS